MTADQFASAALELQERGIIISGHGWRSDLAGKMGWSLQTIKNFERGGTIRIETDYAIAALLSGVPPYPHS